MLVIIIWLVGAVLIGVIGSNKGRSGIGWFLLAVIISPLLALFVVLAVKDRTRRGLVPADEYGEDDYAPRRQSLTRAIIFVFLVALVAWVAWYQTRNTAAPPSPTVAGLSAPRLVPTASAPPAAPAEVQIPRSVAGDKGTYFLLEATRKGDVVTAVHKRVGVDSVGFTRTQTNCATMQMRELGYSEVSPAAIERPASSQWFELVAGSSKSDLANFVCARTK
jgi:hypothetical protein